MAFQRGEAAAELGECWSREMFEDVGSEGRCRPSSRSRRREELQGSVVGLAVSPDAAQLRVHHVIARDRHKVDLCRASAAPTRGAGLRHERTTETRDVVTDTLCEVSFSIPGCSKLEIEVPCNVVRDIVAISQGVPDPSPGLSLGGWREVNGGEPIVVGATRDHNLDGITGTEDPGAEHRIGRRDQNCDSSSKATSGTRDTASKADFSCLHEAGPDTSIVRGPVGFLKEHDISSVERGV